MSARTLTQSDYDRIIREACRALRIDVKGVSPSHPTEKDYLHAIWLGIAAHIGWAMPMLPPANGRSEIDLLRDEIHRLVADHQSANFPIQPTLHEHVNA